MTARAPLSRQTQAVYGRRGVQYDDERSRRLFERVWLDRFLARLPPAPTVLDAGCGAGAPLAEYLVAQGCRLTGIDTCAPLLAHARTRLPQATWQEADMRTLDLGTQFEGILGWHSFFHLTPEEQRETLPQFAAHLRPGGALLLTVGPRAGEVVGRVGVSLSIMPAWTRRIMGRSWPGWACPSCALCPKTPNAIRPRFFWRRKPNNRPRPSPPGITPTGESAPRWRSPGSPPWAPSI